ncbi:MAG: ATP-binding cassette domain-containing protein [Armatimonadetes bacterium]|nr:ATP-binding cassette domain-containing protein [Armatimonadota bacterium]
MPDASEIGLALSLRGVSKRYPGTLAVDRVDFSLRSGEIHALVGENGAGKSTLVKIIAGAFSDYTGQALINGKEVALRSPSAAKAQGIELIHQELSLALPRSVAENVLSGRLPVRAGFWVDDRRLEADARIWLEAVGLDLDPATPVEELSRHEAQLVEIARALANMPCILVLDEPTSSLSREETDRLFELLRRLRSKGLAIVYISHHLPEIFAIADRVTVMRDGRKVAEESLHDVSPERLVGLMVAGAAAGLRPRRSSEPGGVRLEVAGAGRKGFFTDISFNVRACEVLGIGGLSGSGRTELARSLCRIDPLHSGTVTLDGAPVARGGPSAAIRRGLAYLTEDRKGDGLALRLTVSDNVLAAATPGRTQKGWLAPRAGGVAALLDQLAVQPRDPRRQAAGLSGGNQQKALLARWLAVNPEVLFLDEPTRGVDVAAKAAIHEAIVRLAEAGKCVVLISSDLPELVALSDRVLVMRQGRVEAELAREQCSEEAVLLAANGRPVPGETRAGTPVPPTAVAPPATTPPGAGETRAGTPVPPDVGDAVARGLRHGAAGRRWLALAAAALALAVAAMLAPRALFSPANLLSVVQAVAILGVVACGVCFTTYTGHYADLSVPSAMAFSGIVTIWALPHGLGPALAAGLGVGLAVGVVNGAAIGWLRVNPIIWTLATGAAVGGLIRWVFSGEQVYPDEALAAGRTFLELYGGKVWGPVTLAVAAMGTAALAAGALLRGTLFGFHARLTGASYEAARLSGAPVGGVVAAAFALSGLAAAVGGILLASLNKVGAPYIGKGYDFLAVTAIVLGGMSLAGGRGGAGGVLGGVLVIGLLRSAMNLIGLNSFLQEIAQGMVFIAVVGAHVLLLRRQGLDDA